MATSAHDDRRRRAGAALARLAASVQLADQARGRAAGLSLHSVDAVVLGLLRTYGPLTPRELARHAEVSSSGTITGAIDRLERAGWTCRTPCQVDRRKVFVTLTDAAGAGVPADLVDAVAGCSDDQLAAVEAVVARVAAAPTGA